MFPQEKSEKSAKINIFVSTVQLREKYEHIGEEIKMMDLVPDVCVCLCAFLTVYMSVWALQSFLAATIGALFLHMYMHVLF